MYYRHGLAPAILVHWAANYFVFSYAYYVALATSTTAAAAFDHSMLQTLEGVFVAAGAIAAALMGLGLAARVRRAAGGKGRDGPRSAPPAAPSPAAASAVPAS